LSKKFVERKGESMHKEVLLKQLYDALANGDEIEKVKVKFKNGEEMKLVFDAEEDEEDEDEEEDEEDEEDEDEEEDEEDEEDEDDEEDEKDDVKDAVVEDNAPGWKVNVID
jgi:cobalamin biosynthesis protein CobT